jgi:hypothetical protein
MRSTNNTDAWVYLFLIVLGLLAYHFEGGTTEGNIFALLMVIGGVLELIRGSVLKSVENLIVQTVPTLAKGLGLSLQNNNSGNNNGGNQQNSGTLTAPVN